MLKLTTLLWRVGKRYTTAMSIFATSSVAPSPKSLVSGRAALAVAGILIVLVTAQLFSFEDLPQVIDDMWLPGVNTALATVLASVLVVAEVFALPFLLRLQLSIAMRFVSMVLGWLVGAWWLAVLVWQNISASALANNGLLGSTVELPVGWWTVALQCAVLVLIGWASWGLWPVSGRTK